MKIAIKNHSYFLITYVLLVALFLLSMFVFPEKVLLHYTLCIFVVSGIFFTFIYSLFFVKEKKALTLTITGITGLLLLFFIIFAFYLPEAGIPPVIDLLNDKINY